MMGTGQTRTLRVGAVAPDFELFELRGGTVRLARVLASFRALLVFYRGGWCPLCNRQLTELAQHHHGFATRRIEILAVSNEPSWEAGRAVVEACLPQLRILVDPASAVVERYGLLADKRDALGWLLGKRDYAEPAVVLVEQSRRVSWIHRGKTHRERPTPEQILAAADRARDCATSEPPRARREGP